MRARWRRGPPGGYGPTTGEEEPRFSLESGGFLGLATFRRRSRGRFPGPGFRPAFFAGGSLLQRARGDGRALTSQGSRVRGKWLAAPATDHARKTQNQAGNSAAPQ
jgi:hypothetical protein